MGGQCPGAPELKGPREKGKKKMKNRKEKKEKKKKKGKGEKKGEKRENKTFQIHGRGPNPIYPYESK